MQAVATSAGSQVYTQTRRQFTWRGRGHSYRHHIDSLIIMQTCRFINAKTQTDKLVGLQAARKKGMLVDRKERWHRQARVYMLQPAASTTISKSSAVPPLPPGRHTDRLMEKEAIHERGRGGKVEKRGDRLDILLLGLASCEHIGGLRIPPYITKAVF